MPSFADLLKSLPFFLAAALLLIVMQLFEPDLGGRLIYQRADILNGEPWRLLTAHLVHANWTHLWLDLAGLMLVWLLFGEFATSRRWLTISLVTALGLSLAMLMFDPDMQRYRGISGVGHGLMMAGAVFALPKSRPWGLAWVMLLAAKILWEQLFGPIPGSEAAVGGRVAIDAHAYGVILGGACAGWLSWRSPR